MPVLEQTLRWVTAIGVPLLITLIVPFGFAMSRDIGEIKGELLRINAHLERLEQRADRTDAANGERFNGIDARFDEMDARFEGLARSDEVDARFDEMDARVEGLARSDDVDARFDEMDARVDGLARSDEVDARFDEMDARFDGLARSDEVDARFAGVGAEFDALRSWTEARLDDRFAAAEARADDRFAAVEAHLNDRFAAAEARSGDRFAETGRRLERLEAAGAARDERLDAFALELARTNERLSAIDEVVRDNRALLLRRGEQIDEIARGLERTETDPAIVLSRIGVPIDADVAAFWIGGRVVSVPRTEEAQKALIEAGFERVPVSPAIIGYVAPTTGATPRARDP
jgi:vacuolar-type H+-ATPase subunit I/STV1